MPTVASDSTAPIAPGSRIVVRDCEWLVRRVDRTSTGGKAITAVGISELVRDKETVFLDAIETPVVLDPADTRIVVDSSSSYRASLLYMESLLRQTAPTDDHLYIGHRAAMDLLPFQLDPAIQALEQPRQRILIADAVGLGKTLEAGILLSELIRRGRGKRILVLAVKSMLTQFQKELWSRFTIPLTRLDSIGIQRVRQRIPTNHNPFYYFDRSIISIDTLKQDAEYRTYLEDAYWDVIVVDEAHNVAERGARVSMRARLAKLLASRSDTLIMLSATPHDGRARSFASLMNMLDPTAIANPEDYGPDDIKGLFIRRFKKDIQDQVVGSFKKRSIRIARTRASEPEEEAYRALTRISFARIDKRLQKGQQLFKTLLEKSLFSSPSACLATIATRIGNLQRTVRERAAEGKPDEPGYQADIRSLERLAEALEPLSSADDAPAEFGKYQKLLQVIRGSRKKSDDSKGFGWTGKRANDRLVIFTERIPTMRFLHTHLTRDLELSDDQVVVLHGGMSDVDQQNIVERFGQDRDPVRLLIASDVASEGINLHYLCHRMIHFDIPWSLMVFKQRNGRIDRYGQTRTPEIVYLVTESENEKIKGDTRILELLITKDQQAVDNIGDPSTWMGVYDIDTEELITGQAMADGASAEAFEAQLEESAFDPLAALMSGSPPAGSDACDRTRPVHSLFADDFSYLQAAIKQIQEREWLQVEFDAHEQRMELTAPEDLEHRFRFLPPEIWPDGGAFQLCADPEVIAREIQRSRKDEKAWPKTQYLWPLHPVLEWANDKVLAAFGRHEAPLITLPADRLAAGHATFVLSGLIPNRKSHPLLSIWFAVTMGPDGSHQRTEPLEQMQERIRLGERPLANRDADPAVLKDDIASLQALLPAVINEHARAFLRGQRDDFEKSINAKLDTQLQALEVLRAKQYAEIHRRLEETRSRRRRDEHEEAAAQDRRRIDRQFDEFIEWIEDTMTTEDNPYIKLVALLRGVAQ